MVKIEIVYKSGATITSNFESFYVAQKDGLEYIKFVPCKDSPFIYINLDLESIASIMDKTGR